MPAARMLWVCPRWSTDLDAKIGLILGGGRWTTTLGVRWVRRRLGRLLDELPALPRGGRFGVSVNQRGAVRVPSPFVSPGTVCSAPLSSSNDHLWPRM